MKNKKRFFGVLVGLLSIVLCGMLMVGCGTNEGGNDSTQGDNTEVVSTQGTEVLDSNTEKTTESVDETEETESTEETETTEKELPDEAESSLKEEETIVTIKPTNDDVDNGSGNKESEVYKAPAAASAKNPIVKVVTGELPVELSSGKIPAGKTLYYKLTATKGNYISIDDKDAYIVYGDKKYQANETGKVQLEIKEDVIEIAIGNSGKSAKNFVISIDRPPLGSSGNPYVVDSLPEDGVVVSEAVAAGSTLYYKVSGVSEMVLTIEDQTAYVIYNGTKYTADANGVVNVEMGKLNGAAVFQIGNSSKTGETIYEMIFAYPLGSEQNPIVLELEKVPGSVFVEVPAGETLYYNSGIIGGTELSIEDATASVIYQGQTYGAENGVVSLKFAATTSNREPIGFAIKNIGTSDKTYTLIFEIKYTEGTINNPEEINAGLEIKSHEFATGDECYYYRWTAPADGTMKFDISNTVASVGWQYSISSESKGIADVYYSDAEEQVPSKEYTVSKDDVFIIKVGTYDAETQAIMAGTISFTLSFTESVRAVTASNPDDINSVESTEIVESTEEIVSTEDAEETESIEIAEPVALNLIRNWYFKLFTK